jgi:diaminohydroxyphosphoribosylaminopyrimidine deaminase/5-amino-6-(5-phosphoribosylamino)uracil reductase
MFSSLDYQYMAQAIKLAERGLYTTDPNPRVGCVLVRDRQVIGQGWHEYAGQAHAEINALQDAGNDAHGATVYVTLEPCAHHGKTPPCSQALIDAGVSRVICAMRDPNPLVAGNGIEQLRQAGIQVEDGLLAGEAEKLNPGFLKRMREQRPYVRCKLAMSLDARTAMANGESKWITGPKAREDVHRLRARSSAIMTGINTVIADDPSLTCRLDASQGDAVKAAQPLRVILDTQGRLKSDAKLLQQPGNTLVLCGNRQALQVLDSERVVVKQLETDNGRIALAAVMRELAAGQINEVLLEAGATLSGTMLQAGLVDELIIYMAPVLMGDKARGLLKLPGLEHMADRCHLNITDIRAVGQDWRITAIPAITEVS